MQLDLKIYMFMAHKATGLYQQTFDRIAWASLYHTMEALLDTLGSLIAHHQRETWLCRVLILREEQKEVRVEAFPGW